MSNKNKNKIINQGNLNKAKQQQQYENVAKNMQESIALKTEIEEKKQKARSKKQKIVRALFSVVILVALALAIYLPLQLTGTLQKIDSVEELKNLILSGGGWSAFVFGAIQFLQVTILPLPAMITTIAGALIFGPWNAFLISFAAIMLGSIFAFWLGKKVGKNVVGWIVGQEDANKWSKKLERGKYVFFLMMLFPVFPDDILCLIAGITSMSYKFFIITNLITRPLAIICTCFFGSGSIIPFSGWGIYVWAALIVFGIMAFYLAIKYQQKIENTFATLSIKLTRKRDYKRRLKLAAECAKSTELEKHKNENMNNSENNNNANNDLNKKEKNKN